MYNLPYFKEEDPKVVMDFIHAHPFAFITGCSTDGKPVATQIPVFIEEKEDGLFLTGHMMKHTDHHKAFEKNTNVLCVFTGHHCYVSATLYSDPHQASTWNYMSVHVRGQLQFLDDAGLIEVLKKTSAHFENYNQQSPTTFDNLPKEYTDRLMKAIVAFKVHVEEIENVFKLSQNRDKQSYQNIITHLNEGDPDEKTIAGEMLKRQSQLFSK